ncbi:hypothetical protein [Oceanisphaera sp. W20_SRM_FM3]|uniref:hypothetical protein n=1 Tax=Oceanisphaera sp. W20_SRM_FM3 TaxID=3240267 RepID=UPI003F99D09D
MSVLKTSLLTYRDDGIKVEKADLLPVYRYPLTMAGVKFWQWRECLDTQLSAHSYPYYLCGPYLYVALQNESDRLPIIKADDGSELVPERVSYAPVHNHIWLKLLLRRVGHQAGKTQGYRALGKPLLKLDEWAGANPGVETIDIDAVVRQRRDKCTTEVQLSFSNVMLRKLKVGEARRGRLWERGQDGWFARWFCGQGKEEAVLYREIVKSKNTRQQRPFLDLTSPKGLNASRSYVIQQVVETFTELALGYGFVLQAEQLNITHYEAHHKEGQQRLASLPVANFPITLIDARENIEIPFAKLQPFFQSLLTKQGVEVELRLPLAPTNDLHDICFLPQQRYLVILDQGKGLPDDPYHITQGKMHAVPNAAVQHLIINPNEMDAKINIEQWFSRDEEDQITEVHKDYYAYQFADLLACANSLAIKLAVCVKELHFKQLMRDPCARISGYLPWHAAHLADISLVAEGCLFTVQDDRPQVLPLTLSDPSTRLRLNALLARHNIDCQTLLATLLQQWPYGYSPQQEINTDVDKFIKKQVILLQGQQQLLLQSPQHHTPILTPQGLGEITPILAGRKENYPLASWRLPHDYQYKPRPAVLRQMLITGETVSEHMLQKLLTHLPQLCLDWQQVLVEQGALEKVSFEPLRKAFNKRAELSVGKDKNLFGLWWQWLSATLNRPIYDPRVWLRSIPGLKGLWLDEAKGVYLVGQISNLKLKLMRQPSIYRWHALRGELNADTLMPLLDVDFVRMGSLAGRVYPHLFIRLFKELEKLEQAYG